MRARVLNVPAIVRAAGCVLVAAGIIAAALQFRRAGVAEPPAASRVDPLAAALARCQLLGMAAESDVGCQATWAESRRRFFDETPAPEAR